MCWAVVDNCIGLLSRVSLVSGKCCRCRIATYKPVIPGALRLNQRSEIKGSGMGGETAGVCAGKMPPCFAQKCTGFRVFQRRGTGGKRRGSGRQLGKGTDKGFAYHACFAWFFFVIRGRLCAAKYPFRRSGRWQRASCVNRLMPKLLQRKSAPWRSVSSYLRGLDGRRFSSMRAPAF